MGFTWTKQHSVVVYNPSKAYDGYTLIDPFMTGDLWLMDMKGNFVHRWVLPTMPRNHGMILPNGNLLYATSAPVRERNPNFPKVWGLGSGVLEVDWDSNLVWKYVDPSQHHTYYRMGNGNTMILRWERVPSEIAAKVQGGTPGTEDDGTMWTDGFHEVTPDGKVIWKWSMANHLDPKLDIMCPLCRRNEWTHGNSCVVLPDGNILTSFRNTHFICIIDKATGDIKWRWGPGEIAHQHDPSPLDNGNILVFDNGGHRPGTTISYSRVVEVNLNTNKIEWEYKADPPESFYSALISGAQRLPNGNTLICEGTKGRIFEVTIEGEIVWEYISPFYAYSPHHASLGNNNFIFRAYRYAPDFEGFNGKELDPQKFTVVNQLYGPSAYG